ncbi:MAG: caspase family protein [Muribaculaceae bacterium]|nr:caspase family protein [Muribaculaceae bacterium]
MSNALNSMSNGNIEEAFNLINHAANTNDLLAQYYLAQCYEHGIGVTPDKTQAFKLYRRAAERGLPAAMKELSRLYSNGIGAYKSIEKATEWQNRYLRKNDNISLPDIVEAYNKGLTCAPASPTSTSSNEKIIAEIPDKKTTTPSPTSLGTRQIANSSLKTIPSVSETNEQEQKSDVDVDVPITKDINDLTFAFIFANEDYQEVANVPHALNDGERFAEYCQKTFGIPKTNVHLIKNGTLNNIRREINLMKEIAQAYKGEASFIIYYAGHGIPDEDSRKAYLLPTDGYPTDLSTCYSLNDLYRTIGDLPVKRNIVFLDACFSGATRDNDMVMAARGVVLKPKEAKATGNTLIMASAFGNETSYAYDEKNHGMFTYFLLKKIKESKGNITMDSLFEYLKDNVSKMSIVVNRKPQTPTLSISPILGDDWKVWEIK